MTPVSIYALVDPRDALPFYIGASCHPTTRRSQHIHERVWRTTPTGVRIRAICDAGLQPEIRILEVTDRTNSKTQEGWWILYYESIGIRLTNAVAATGVKDRRLDAIRSGNRARWDAMTDDERAATVSRMNTSETSAKKSVALSSRLNSMTPDEKAEHYRKVVATRKARGGYVHTPEQLAANRATNQAHWANMTDEQREAHSAKLRQAHARRKASQVTPSDDSHA